MKKFLEKIKNKILVVFIDQLLYRFASHNVLWSGASLTYFLILSIFPFLIVLLNLLSYTSLVRERAILDLIHFLPLDIVAIIEGFLNDLSRSSSQELLSVAAFLGIWTASSGVKAIIKAINLAYDYAENRHFLKLRGLSVLFTLALLLMITIVMISLILGPVLARTLFDRFGYGDSFTTLWNYLRYIIPLGYMILIFALLYKFSPNIGKNLRIPMREVLPGAVFTTVAWVSLSLLLSYYVANFGKYAITYGSLGGVIVLLIWIYYSSVVIVLGGEINATLEDMRKNGLKVNPDRSALYKDLDT